MYSFYYMYKVKQYSNNKSNALKFSVANLSL